MPPLPETTFGFYRTLSGTRVSKPPFISFFPPPSRVNGSLPAPASRLSYYCYNFFSLSLKSLFRSLLLSLSLPFLSLSIFLSLTARPLCPGTRAKGLRPFPIFLLDPRGRTFPAGAADSLLYGCMQQGRWCTRPSPLICAAGGGCSSSLHEHDPEQRSRGRLSSVYVPV